jgi:peroxiredoxin
MPRNAVGGPSQPRQPIHTLARRRKGEPGRRQRRLELRLRALLGFGQDHLTARQRMDFGIAFDISFKTDAGEEYVLHRFVGREVLLNFWQSWSAPCLAELSRLQRLHEGRGKAPFIVAFHGGNNRDALKEIRKRLGLTFPLVQDSQQQIAQQFGVRSWPTTVLIGVDGRTEQIQFGVAHEHATPSSR